MKDVTSNLHNEELLDMDVFEPNIVTALHVHLIW